MLPKLARLILSELQGAPHSLLGSKHNANQPLASRCLEISHLAHMPIEDDAAVARIVGIIDQDHPANVVLPQQLSARRVAQLAAGNWALIHKTSTGESCRHSVRARVA